MSVIADLIRAGVDPDLIAKVSDELVAAASGNSRRSKHADAQARYQARQDAKAESEMISSDHNDQADLIVVEKEKAPHTPKKENPQSKENPPKGGQKKGFPLPAGWAPNAVDWGGAVRVLGQRSAESELSKFRDYWPGIPGEKGRKLDWDGTWRNWVRKAAEFGARAGPRKSGGSVLAELAGFFGGQDERFDSPDEGQSASGSVQGSSGFAGRVSERDRGNGGPFLDLRPAGSERE